MVLGISAGAQALLRTTERLAKSLLKINHHLQYSYNGSIILTANPLDLEYEKKILGRSRLCVMCTGDFRSKDSSISLATEGGADADSAINGTLANALKPPSLLKDVLKSEPLKKYTKECSMCD